MARSERKKNEGSGEWRGKGGDGEEMGRRGAESSIIEGNLAAAAEGTMAGFHPASVGDFLVDLITPRVS